MRPESEDDYYRDSSKLSFLEASEVASRPAPLTKKLFVKKDVQMLSLSHWGLWLLLSLSFWGLIGNTGLYYMIRTILPFYPTKNQ